MFAIKDEIFVALKSKTKELETQGMKEEKEESEAEEGSEVDSEKSVAKVQKQIRVKNGGS